MGRGGGAGGAEDSVWPVVLAPTNRTRGLLRSRRKRRGSLLENRRSLCSRPLSVAPSGWLGLVEDDAKAETEAPAEESGLAEAEGLPSTVGGGAGGGGGGGGRPSRGRRSPERAALSASRPR